MADKDRFVYTKDGDKVKIAKVAFKNIEKLSDAAKTMLYQIKAYPLTRGAKQEEELLDFRRSIDEIIDKETDRLVSSDAGASGADIAKLFNTVLRNNTKGNNIDIRSLLQNQTLEELMNDQNAQINLLLSERYKNISSVYEDIKLVTEQLAELSEVIDSFRDAIVNADNSFSDVSRLIKFSNKTVDTKDNTVGMQAVETMERDTGIKNKLKKIIIPETLRYGNFFVLTQPYKEIFANFKALDKKYLQGRGLQNTAVVSRIGESYIPKYVPDQRDSDEIGYFFESFAPIFEDVESSLGISKSARTTRESFEKTFNDFVSENIEVINDELVPLLESDQVSTLAFSDIRDSVCQVMRDKMKTSKNAPTIPKFTEGSVDIKKTPFEQDYEKFLSEYSDITGVYIKLYDPRKVIPVYVMDYCIGYYVLYETAHKTSTSILNSVHTLSRTTMLFRDEKKKEYENKFIALIADRICRSIDKPFLKNNQEFKTLIANAIAYDKFYMKSFRVQFVTSRYMTHFKINEDSNTHLGQSVLYRSLWYAMLYMMMLLFTILMKLRSGNIRMFLIKGNGVDTDISKKINDIVGDFRSKQISYNDFGSVRGILSKVGQGKDIGVPVGVNNEKAFDIEQLDGMDVDLDDPLIELLRKAMISTTGCPSAIINYLEEVDFAKQIQMIHSKFMARSISFQEETEVDCTELYRKILRYGDYGLSETDINSVEFTWARPKSLITQNLGDLISTTDQLAEFMIKVLEGDNTVNDPRVKDRLFRFFVRKYLMNGIFDWDKLEEEITPLILELRSDIQEEDASKIQSQNQ